MSNSKQSPAILVTTPPTSPVSPTLPLSTSSPLSPSSMESGGGGSVLQDQSDGNLLSGSSKPPGSSPATTPGGSRSFLNVDYDRRPPPQHRGGSMAAIRRHTVMLARDVLLRRFSRNDPSNISLRYRITLEEFEKLAHEVNHMVATYRQLLQTLGTHSEVSQTRKDLASCRKQCIHNCESAKNCIMPLLKEDTEDTPDCNQNSEIARHASHQFIGCLNMFIVEMKRTQGLLRALPPPGQTPHSHIAVSSPISPSNPNSLTDGSSYMTAGGSSVDVKMDDESETLSRDLIEAEQLLEALENAITIHFSIGSARNTETLYPAPKTKKAGRQYGKFCLYFRTNYA